MFLGLIYSLNKALDWKNALKYFIMKYETEPSSPDELCVESTPALALSSLPWPFQHPVLMNQICQPISTAVTQHIAVQEDQLALWPIEPVVVGICNRYGPLKSWEDRETQRGNFSDLQKHLSM